MSEVDLPRRLDRYDGIATIRRIALSDPDVGPGTALPSFDAATKVGDPRHRWFVENYGARCWELDAMSPVDLRRRVEAEIYCLLDQAAWQHAVDVETVEVESMRTFLTDWNSKSGQASKYSGGAE